MYMCVCNRPEVVSVELIQSGSGAVWIRLNIVLNVCPITTLFCLQQKYLQLLYIHVLTRPHTYVHTYIRTYIHTYIRTYVHTYDVLDTL